MKPIDISKPLRHGMARYAADPAFEFETVRDVKKGATVKLKRFRFGSYSGTYVDQSVSLLCGRKKGRCAACRLLHRHDKDTFV